MRFRHSRSLGRPGATVLVIAICLAACGSGEGDQQAESDASEPFDASELPDANAPCGADQHVLGHACVACPPGTTNEAGDAPSGDDTACDPVFCGADEHVVTHACESCPAESSNEAGDDASGDDTTCDDACSVVFGVVCGVFEEGYLKASNTSPNEDFGRAVALSGDTLAVGAIAEDSAATGVDGDQTDNSAPTSGAVYVFKRTAGVWHQQAYLKASNTEAGDAFGGSVALSGDTLAVGAGGEDSAATGVDGDQTDNSAEGSGAVYVFTRTADVWSQQAYLKASNTGVHDAFWGVALSGDTLAVSATQEDSAATGVDGDQADNSAGGAGAVYVFTRTGGVWSQQAYVKASNTDFGDYFGQGLALSGDTLAVGAVREDSFATGVDGDQTDNSVMHSGAVYVFTRTAGVWSQEAYLKASNTGVYDEFGVSVALSGDTLAVGAWNERSAATGVGGDQSDDSAAYSGAVYLFTREAGVWSQQAYVKASNTGGSDVFGVSVALFENMLAVGATSERSSATGVNGDQTDNSAAHSGAVYVFTRTAGTWSQQAYLKASNTDAWDFFGAGLALSANTLAVGAAGEGSAATGVDGNQTDNSANGSGATYVRRIAP